MIWLPCQECKHATVMHFFDPDTPDFGLCMIAEPENCDCTCRWLREQVQDG